MTATLLCLLLLIPAFAIPALAACRGGTATRLAALQLATGIATTVLVLSTFAFDQSPSIDLPLALAILSLPATLLIALFLERWL